MGLRQSFAWWSFEAHDSSERDILKTAAKIGFTGVDFLPRELWSRANDLGLAVTIIDGHDSLEVGFNDRTKHNALRAEVLENLDRAAAGGIPYLAVNAGNRLDGLSDSDAARVCAEALSPLAELATAGGVTLLLEPLNSKVDHLGNQCDSSSWANMVIRMADSPGLKMLYDVYHMQIMEGNILSTLQSLLPEIKHIHTAGVPGRHELDDLQEIHWQGVARLLREQRYDGFVGHEFTPRGDAEAALRNAYQVFN
jgi:hydroxypyruvate isomerase